MATTPTQAVTTTFRVLNLLEQLVDADSLPTAVLYRNGTATAVVVTVASITGDGKYSASWTNAGYSVGDQLSLEVTAIVDEISYTDVVWQSSIADLAGIATLLDRVTGLIQTKAQADTDQTAILSAIEDTLSTEIPTFTVTRFAGDEQPIRFRFPTTEADITSTKRIDGAAEVACVGAVTEIDNGLPGYWYSLAFEAADRDEDKQVVYKFTDGTDTIYVRLQFDETPTATEISQQIAGEIESEFGTWEDGLSNLSTWVATEVRTELQTELNRIDVGISTRATPDDVSPTITPPSITINPTTLDSSEREAIAVSVWESEERTLTAIDKDFIRAALNGKWQDLYQPSLIHLWQVTDASNTPDPGDDLISNAE